ncbi:MAG: UTRA domain-containing protein [Pseudodesulfovibrio sp.]|nr:UTRA domain-containing protein [Pseudodesulfovibrio sp.]
MPKKNLSTRIREFIMTHIKDGTWPSGHKIPSESEMMKLFSASRMTVHRTVKEMAAQGHLFRERGRGTFVEKDVPRSELLNIGDIAEEIAERGGTYFSQLKFLDREPKSPLTTHVFGVHAGNIARSKVVHYENGNPLQLEDRWVNLDVVPHYLETDFALTTAHQLLMQAAPLQKAEHQLTAALPTQEQQDFLKVQANEPCLLLKRKTWSGDTIVSYAELLYPASRYSFGGVFTPGTK